MNSIKNKLKRAELEITFSRDIILHLESQLLKVREHRDLLTKENNILKNDQKK